MPGSSDLRRARWLHIGLAQIISLGLVCPGLPQNATTRALPVHTPDRVNEEMFVRIGGIDQWITIKGDDRTNPVVLFLHGGPGDALSPFADAMYVGWGSEFTLVQWDQRGAGRTYAKSGPSIEPTMTVQRMADDGIEVAEFLTKYLNKKENHYRGRFLGLDPRRLYGS